MSSGEPPTSQSFTPFWIAGPGSPSTPVVGNPVANPVAPADLASLGGGGVASSVPSAMSQDITTMANAVPHDDFTNGLSEPQAPPPPPEPQQQQQQQQVAPAESPTIVKAQPPDPPLDAVQVQTVQVQAVQVQRGSVQASQVQVTQVQAGQVQGSGGATEVRVVEGANPPACSSGAPAQFFHASIEPVAKEVQETLDKKKIKVQRRRLSPSHREMIIDLVFNEKKTSREVARYMGLPQSTVMSVVQVFKKEHRIHKKTATGRKRRLTTAQEFQLFEMSKERDNISVDEIRTRFLQTFPDFGHISKTTIYRTLERGKKGLIGMDPPPERYLEPIERFWGLKKKMKPKKMGGGADQGANHSMLEPSVSIMEETGPIETNSQEKDIVSRQRSLFFNENRTIREVADFMHLAKSTVSSVVQVFKKEHRIQRKTSTGRKKKLSDEHEQMIMDILSQKEDITIEETRNRFLSLNPEVPNISKSTIYRIMENCQSKLRARSDMEVFVGSFVHSTDDAPMIVLPSMVMGVLNTKVMPPFFHDTSHSASHVTKLFKYIIQFLFFLIYFT
ncbi:hypothetical protein GWK47_040156 [Chionoecetes opilio]|uniref:Uncharacterized protein n=1 Tax=Chionoecetes opilio TaxID=41210 RepID=A0A8J4YJM9_CHIOP|nr:hypothetical protein GWK47_040156 [Chionoecetes opilio]